MNRTTAVGGNTAHRCSGSSNGGGTTPSVTMAMPATSVSLHPDVTGHCVNLCPGGVPMSGWITVVTVV